MDATERMSKELDSVLPDAKAISDLWQTFGGHVVEGVLSLEFEAGSVSIPENTPVFVVSKIFYKEAFDLPLATYKVMLSFGQVRPKPGAMLESKFCFVTLHYNRDAVVYTSDIHQEFR